MITKVRPLDCQELNMGIHGLMKLLSEEAPASIKEVDLAGLTGTVKYINH